MCHVTSKRSLEEYRQGYPRLAAFLCLDKDFTVFKRFNYLHTRTLLELQDQLAKLETQLNDCDDTDRVELGLRNRRHDSNQERRDLLEQIRTRLQIYDKAVLDFNNMLRLPEAQHMQCQSVHNWVVGNKPLVRSESSCYLACLESEDYVVLGQDESEKAGMESLIDVMMKSLPAVARHFSISSARTEDRHIYLFPPKLLACISKTILGVLLPLWLIFPIILLVHSSDSSIRIVIYCVFTFGTSFVIIWMANTSKYDLILALITYTALLSVFISGSTSA